jgi:hypothetical protein
MLPRPQVFKYPPDRARTPERPAASSGNQAPSPSRRSPVQNDPIFFDRRIASATAIWSFRQLAHHELDKFGEGTSIQIAKDGRRIRWPSKPALVRTVIRSKKRRPKAPPIYAWSCLRGFAAADPPEADEGRAEERQRGRLRGPNRRHQSD